MISDEEKKKILEYEDLFSEISKRRNPKSNKGWWEAPGVLPSITAVLTVALTSLGAYCTQSRLRENDMVIQQSKAAYESRVAALQSAHLLASRSFHWASERARLRVGDYVGLPDDQKKPILDSVNVSDFRWRQGREQEKVGVELGFGRKPELIRAWDTTVARLNQYASCTAATPPRDCTSLREPARAMIDSFRKIGVAHIDQPGSTISK